MPSLQITSLRFEHHPTGLGVSSTAPRLSWHVDSDTIPQHWQQQSYEISITRGSRRPQTFHVNSDSTTLVPWPDSPLASGEAASVCVKSNGSTDEGNLDTEWSKPATVEAALLSQDDWKAKPITAPPRTNSHPDERGIRPVRFRKTFDAPDIKEGRARLYITALGLYESYLNGARIGDECLAPGWTAYQHRIQYQVFDVGSLLKPGQPNTLAVEVSEGWYAGRVLWGEGLTCFYGDRIGVLAQLDVLDGASSDPAFRLTTDETWECHPSPIVGSDIYDGETYDLGLEVTDWHNDQSKWSTVEALPFPGPSLVASSCPPVRITETVKPVKVFTDPTGKTLVDFGQNLVGKLVVHSLQKPDGHRLKIRHAEVLENGALGVRPLRAAKATDTIIFGGRRGLREWSPHFTYHGFRYAELDGWAADEVTLDSVSAVVMHTDMQRTGFFSCSNDDINALHRNVVWSMRGNFVSIPTDCPQRDERLGWTGDIQIFSPTASFLYDCAGMLGNWMRDVILDQKDANGIVPVVVPNVMKDGPWPAVPQAVWDDVVILVPWTLYKWFGDAGVLQETYPGMKNYLDSIKRGEDGLWDPSLWQLGDWLDPNAPPAEPGLARTDGTLVADAYLVYVTGVISQVASVLDLTADADMFADEHRRLKQLFQDKYITKAGFVVADSQTALALALLFDLHETPAQRTAAAERLARLVQYSKFRVSTGFAGTPVILHALSETGHVQHAYRMLLETGCPSWLYPVRMGATTVWERWDSMLEDGTINPGEMTSFNHYALGSVANWMHASIGGLSPLEAGWKRFRVRPRPGGELKHARAEYVSPNGRIRSRWEMKSEDKLVLELTVPPNATAVVSLPDGSEETTVGSGTYTFESGLAPETKGPWPPKALLTQFGL